MISVLDVQTVRDAVVRGGVVSVLVHRRPGHRQPADTVRTGSVASRRRVEAGLLMSRIQDGKLQVLLADRGDHRSFSRLVICVETSGSISPCDGGEGLAESLWSDETSNSPDNAVARVPPILRGEI